MFQSQQVRLVLPQRDCTEYLTSNKILGPVSPDQLQVSGYRPDPPQHLTVSKDDSSNIVLVSWSPSSCSLGYDLWYTSADLSQGCCWNKMIFNNFIINQPKIKNIFCKILISTVLISMVMWPWVREWLKMCGFWMWTWPSAWTTASGWWRWWGWSSVTR